MAAAKESETTTELSITETTTFEIDTDISETYTSETDIDISETVQPESIAVQTANYLIKLFTNIQRIKNGEIDSHVVKLVGDLVIPLLGENNIKVLTNLLNNHIGTLKLPERVVITDDNIATLTNLLARNTTITKLVISFNTIGNVGAGLFAINLAQNTSIKILDLSYNLISDTGAILLAAALSKNNSITMVDLCGNSFTEVGRSALDAVRIARPTLCIYFL